MTHRGRHSAREPLALALATGRSVRDACQALGLGERTAHRWAKEPEFKDRVNELRGELVRQALGLLIDSMGLAVERLKDVARGEAPGAAVAACRAILDYGLRFREHFELSDRVDCLEALTYGKAKGKKA